MNCCRPPPAPSRPPAVLALVACRLFAPFPFDLSPEQPEAASNERGLEGQGGPFAVEDFGMWRGGREGAGAGGELSRCVSLGFGGRQALAPRRRR